MQKTSLRKKIKVFSVEEENWIDPEFFFEHESCEFFEIKRPIAEICVLDEKTAYLPFTTLPKYPVKVNIEIQDLLKAFKHVSIIIY